MKYVVTLNHADFTLLMTVLKKSENCSIISWNACDFVCNNTKVEYEESEE